MLNYVMKHNSMKAYEECGGVAPPFLTSALDGDEWSASRTYHISPGDGVPSTRCIRGWVGLTPGLDAVKKNKVLSVPGFEPRSFNQ
jgi:hypothetical protein